MAYTRAELEALPRTKLQTICKGIGFKANEATSKIIDNILTYQADNAAHRSRSTKSAAPTHVPDPSSRRVTRGSESSKQNQLQETKTTRRTSSRFTSNPLKSATNANQHRKSKATQISLGVGRPKGAGGSGARAVTRNSTTSKSRKDSKKGKQRLVEQEIPEEEEEPAASKQNGRQRVDTGPSGAVVVTGLPPTPAATPNLASASHDASVPRDIDGSQLPSVPEFAPVHNLQKEMHELSSQFRIAQEQLKQIPSLQSEVRTLRSAIDKQAGEFEALRQEHRTFSSVKEEVSALKNELQTLRRMYGQIDLHQANGTIQPNLLRQEIEPQAPGTTHQVLGKRGRGSPQLPSFQLSATIPFGVRTERDPAPDASSLSAFQPPKKKQRVIDDGPSNDDQTQSPFRLSSRDEDVLADMVPSNGIDFNTLFIFNNSNNTSNSASGASNDSTVATQASETMLGVPPPGFRADFLTHPTTPLPFALTPSGHSGTVIPENNNDGRSRRNDLVSRKATNSRLNPYRRAPSNTLSMRHRTPSNSNDPFNFFGSDLLSSNMHSANHPEPSVGVNPAQLIAEGLVDPDKTPAAARTLYGTELEGDTRFGEFGIDGLTKSFWKAPGFPC